MTITLNKDVDINTIDTAQILKRAEESLQLYHQVELGFNEGKFSKNYRDDHWTEIFCKSGYQDILDFAYDYARYKAGLPIFIDFRLVEVK